MVNYSDSDLLLQSSPHPAHCCGIQLLISFRDRQRGKLEFKSQFINNVSAFQRRNGDAGLIVLLRLMCLANVSMIK